MSGHLLLVLVVLLGTALALAVVVGLVAASRTAGEPPGTVDVARAPAAYRHARRHAGVVAVVAWAALLVVALTGPVLAAHGRWQGVLLGSIPAAAGLAFLLVGAVGERTWPRPDGTVRRAPLRPRRVADVAPPALRRLTWAWTGGLALATLAFGATAGPDGRSVALTYAAGHSAAAGPYPGWTYGVPLTLAALLVLGAGEGVLRLVTARPVVAATTQDDDARLRRASARRLLAGTQLVLGGTLAGVLGAGGAALRSVGRAHEYAADGVAYSLGAPWVVAAGTAALVAGLAVGVTALVVAARALHRAARDAGAPVVPVPVPVPRLP
ncbi:hypothetical protein [Cellulomonas shaoxiangyii]|uniref:Uncharacterized protein n=1 Tax=Cellulomonas shaoxiangyii TaxID=2566013 RepID=A0A4P7SJ46_9CELL|nr:hypothetical protein [Cellulomonas shaoxiangyii]QCB94100.1 hypothetical protein E5225_11525 [Cellulomonas shaoxiangyii]TGY83738.1 hypothetical protein E5226_11755 [Cellulomonas shaoxiangyii]